MSKQGTKILNSTLKNLCSLPPIFYYSLSSLSAASFTSTSTNIMANLLESMLPLSSLLSESDRQWGLSLGKSMYYRSTPTLAYFIVLWMYPGEHKTLDSDHATNGGPLFPRDMQPLFARFLEWYERADMMAEVWYFGPDHCLTLSSEVRVGPNNGERMVVRADYFHARVLEEDEATMYAIRELTQAWSNCHCGHGQFGWAQDILHHICDRRIAWQFVAVETIRGGASTDVNGGLVEKLVVTLTGRERGGEGQVVNYIVDAFRAGPMIKPMENTTLAYLKNGVRLSVHHPLVVHVGWALVCAPHMVATVPRYKRFIAKMWQKLQAVPVQVNPSSVAVRMARHPPVDLHYGDLLNTILMGDISEDELSEDEMSATESYTPPPPAPRATQDPEDEKKMP